MKDDIVLTSHTPKQFKNNDKPINPPTANLDRAEAPNQEGKLMGMGCVHI